MTEQTLTLENDLAQRFPEILTPDTRKGYPGYFVKAEKLVDFATALRDELGYDYLSSVTAVDYLAEGQMEMVYHARKTTGGSPLVFRVQVPRDQASRAFPCPSISWG